MFLYMNLSVCKCMCVCYIDYKTRKGIVRGEANILNEKEKRERGVFMWLNKLIYPREDLKAAGRNSFYPVCLSETEFVRVVCLSMCNSKAATSLKSVPYMVTFTKPASLELLSQFAIVPTNGLFLKEGPCEPCNSLVSWAL